MVKTMMEIPKEKADMSYSLWRDTKLSQDTGGGWEGGLVLPQNDVTDFGDSPREAFPCLNNG